MKILITDPKKKRIISSFITIIFLFTTSYLSLRYDNGSFLPLLFLPTIVWAAWFGSKAGLISAGAFSFYTFLFIYFVLHARNSLPYISVAVVMLLSVGFVVGKLSELYKKTKIQEARINRVLEEKELLLREIHHRVKNNLNIISGLLLLQTESSDDPKIHTALHEASSRVDSMSRIYDALYRSGDYHSIKVSDYIDNLIHHISALYKNKKIEIHKDIHEVRLEVDTVVSMGIIINELVTNAVKHAFPTDASGTISVMLFPINGRPETVSHTSIKLIISDNGVGLPKNQSIETLEGFGTTVIRSLVEQLNGRIELLHQSRGTRIEITFPSTAVA